MEERDGLNMGVSTSAPYCINFIYPPLPQWSCPPSPALGLRRETERICHNIAFLLVLAEEEATEDRKYGLLTIWVNLVRPGSSPWRKQLRI